MWVPGWCRLFAWANARLKLVRSATVLTRDPERFRRKCPEVANDEAVDLLTGDVTTFEFPEGSFEF